MSEISVVVVGSTSLSSTVGNGDSVNVTIGSSGGDGAGAATIQVGKVTTLSATESASIVNVGTAYAAKLDFALPRGQTGLTGPSGPPSSLSVGTVSTGTAASVSISGEAPSQTISFVLQPGPPNSLSVGSVSAGTAAQVSISGAAPSQSISFVLPQGEPGPANSLKIGTVVTGADAEATLTGTAPDQTLNLVLPQGATGSQGPQGATGPAGPANSLSVDSVSTGSSAAVSITGSAPSQKISFVLPLGPTGPQGSPGPYTTIQVGTTTTGAAGTQAKVDTVSAGGTVTLNFTIPRGVDGNANLADEAPQPLGSASAGVSGFAARADHVHPLQVVSYTALTNVPLLFPPETHTQSIASITGLQSALDGKQPVGSYAPLDGSNKIPSAFLPSYVDDVSEHADLASFPATGEVGKLYVARDSNRVYRWSGSTYIEIASSPGSTDAVPEGSTNLYFTTARAAAAAPVQSVNGKTGAVTIEAGGIAWSSVPTATNSLTKAGSISYDADYLYIATNTDTWRRTFVADWTTPVITITAQPTNQTAAGGSATFSVSASVTQNAELSYQWQRQAGGAGSWVDIATGLSATLSLTDLQYAINNGDKYRVVISSGGAGTSGTAVNGWLPAVVVDITPTAVVTSDAGTLTVAAAISITAQPQSVTLTSDTTAAFSVSATTPGTGLSYQWQSSPDGTNWTAISGATSATLSLTGITQIGYDGLRYRCVVSSSGYSDANSAAALLTVAPITVTTQPSSTTATPIAGTEPAYAATFTVAGASPAGPPSLQWQVSTDAGSNWSDVSGATSASLSLSALAWGDTGKRYRVRLSKAGWNDVTSSAAVLTVPSDSITITTQPSNTTAAVSAFSSQAFTLPEGTWSAVSYAGGKWFATPDNADSGGDYLATSADGINWSQNLTALPSVATWEPVQYGGGVYLTYDKVTQKYATSDDGVSWTARTFSSTTHDVKYVDGVGWLAITINNCLLSQNAISWTNTSLPNIYFRRVYVAGSKVVVTGQGGTTGTPHIATIENGSIGAFQALPGDAADSYLDVVASNSTAVLLGRRESTIPLVLVNTSTLSATQLAFPDGSELIGAVWDAARSRWIVAGWTDSSYGNGGGLYTINATGTSFAKRLSLNIPRSTSQWSNIVLAGGRAVFNGSVGSPPATPVWYTSDDGGITWTLRTGPASWNARPYIAGDRIVAQTSNWNSTLSVAIIGPDTGALINPGGVLSATFSAAATTSFGAPSVQWQVSTDAGANWSDVAGATSPTLSLTPSSADSGKRYRARFTKSLYAAVSSNSAVLTVP